MKPRLLIALAWFVLLVGFMAPRLPAKPPQNPAWKSVEEAIGKGLPQTAVKRLGVIAREADAAGRDAEFVRARVYQMVLKSNLENDPLSQRIATLQTAIESESGPRRAIMRAVLAEWFWSYYQSNRWQFLDRTPVQSAQPSEGGDNDWDIDTWDLARILSEIDRQFQSVLADADVLGKVPTEDYSDLIEVRPRDAQFTPTLYDFVARSALRFYQAGEQAVSTRADAWQPSADGPILAPTDSFLSWKVDADPSTPVVRATRLYQDWIRFRVQRPDSELAAWIAVEVDRVEFAASESVGSRRDQRVEAALIDLATRFAKHPASALASHQWARRVDASGDRVRAREIAFAAAQRYPNSVGGQRCQRLVDEIEQKECRLVTDRVWAGQGQRVALQYRNVNEVFFRMIVDDGSFRGKNSKDRMLAERPIKSWKATLPATDDYQPRNQLVSVNQPLPLGEYILLSGHRSDFSPKDNQIQWARVVRSDLGLITRPHSGSGEVDAIVVHGFNGSPIPGADVTFEVDASRGNRKLSQRHVTDAMGMATFRPLESKSNRSSAVEVTASVEGDSLSADQRSYSYFYSVDRSATIRAVFFTDRAIYRPGQSIHFKAVIGSIDPLGQKYASVPDEDLVVALFDPNGQEVSRVSVRSNRFGSVSGTFTAPRGALNGAMNLRVVEGVAEGQTSVRVEEYKRPKFRVELETPREAALDRDVTMEGSAMSYNGFPVAEAVVEYRVIRHTQYPRWCWWYPSVPPTEIAAGSVSTDIDGKFVVPFTAAAPADADPDASPAFRFEVTADVTDTTGETRSVSQSIRVGFQSLQATLDSASYLTTEDPVSLAVRTETLDQKGQAARGTIEVFAVQQPDRPVRSPLLGTPRGSGDDAGSRRGNEPFGSPDPNTWPTGERVSQVPFQTDESGQAMVEVPLSAGLYRAVLKTVDREGQAVTSQTTLLVIDPVAKEFPAEVASRLLTPPGSYQPGQTAMLYWASGYPDARALVEVVRNEKTLRAEWTPEGTSQYRIDVPIDESMRGGVTVRTTLVHDGEMHVANHTIAVPWENKQLEVTTERFVSKLKPGGEESMTLRIRGSGAEAAAAEVVATMYDASLDAYAKLAWINRFGFFRSERSYLQSRFHSRPTDANTGWNQWRRNRRDVSIRHASFPAELVGGWYGSGWGRPRMLGRSAAPMAAAMMESVPPGDMFAGAAESDDAEELSFFAKADGGAPQKPASQDADGQPDPPPRTNLNETAFFFPALRSGSDGSVTVEFTMPEALTQWRMMAFAHDADLRSGSVEASAVTSKDLMVQPNPPRFLRAGDEIEFTAKVSNASATGQTGSVRLTMRDPFSGEDLAESLSLDSRPQSFDLAAGRSQAFAWKLAVPDGIDAVIYRVTAKSERAGDGEEAALPVLPRKILVTESIQMPIRDAGTSSFEMASLLASEGSQSIDHRLLELQVVSQPAWYVVESLPSLIEYPHQCAEQTFNRMYAGLIAGHLVDSEPRIAETIKRWRANDQLKSPLLENTDLRDVLIEETPWVRQAQSESQTRKQLADLFEANRLKDTIESAAARLEQMQLGDGGWPWFAGGRRSDYITLYITTGYGRLRHMGIDVDVAPAVESISGVDEWMNERYQRIKPEHRDRNQISSIAAMYLYCRSFFRDDVPVAAEHQASWEYWKDQAAKHWVKLGSRQSQAHIAVAMKRFGNRRVAESIVQSLLERSVRSDEMGLHWNQGRSWWWYEAPIETQAMMIEAIDEVAGDADAVEDAKVWLIKQKQTQAWSNTKSTADAVYATLLRGKNLLTSGDLVEATWGGDPVLPTNVEAGSGFYTQRVVGSDVKPSMGEVTLAKKDSGVAWAGLHWQYLEDIEKVPATEGTPLSIEKQLFVKRQTPTGKQLVPIKESGPAGARVQVGDELVVRLVVRTDRDMEFLHLKDHRGSGTEPVDVLSGYQWSGGLFYYQSTGDTATHLFIDRLPEGTYVMEYSTRVQLRGRYQTGLANIQCMYAPEFAAHSQNRSLSVAADDE